MSVKFSEYKERSDKKRGNQWCTHPKIEIENIEEVIKAGNRYYQRNYYCIICGQKVLVVEVELEQ